ncbi:MAG: hypothetical protein IN818_05870 [Cutibacterium sp.]|nr:hypothetical protein [Cutibacterium sp.]
MLRALHKLRLDVSDQPVSRNRGNAEAPMVNDAETCCLPNDNDVVGETRTPRQWALARHRTE